ncbi:MAG: rod shape-determining protein MreD [Clostridium sp.]|jgi:rod shape-determining protein MreD|nr:rod shape-determining protein MreD [Clostridium sp.]
MKNRIILILISIILLVLDNTFSPFIAIGGAWPNFLFVFSIAYSIINGKKEGIIIGVVAGLLQDIFFCQCFGVNALVNMISCFVAGKIGDGIWREKKLIPIITMFVATISKVLIICIILHFMNQNVDLLRGIKTAIYNSVVMLFSYSIILKFFEREDMRKAWRF